MPPLVDRSPTSPDRYPGGIKHYPSGLSVTFLVVWPCRSPTLTHDQDGIGFLWYVLGYDAIVSAVLVVGITIGVQSWVIGVWHD